MPAAPNIERPVEIFCSYSHKDERLRERLDVHLSALKRSGIIRLWHDRRIGPGQEWEREVDTHLDTAGIILLLVSPDFIASEYCYSVELRRAMQRHEVGEARVVPVILRPADWRDVPFRKLLALPTDGKPITSWSNRDAAFLNVVTGIRDAAAAISTGGDGTQRRPKGSTPEQCQLMGYGGSVLHVGGIGSHLFTKAVWALDEHAYLKPVDDYITHSFNGGGDILWVSCPDAFRIVHAESPTGNETFAFDPQQLDSPYGILLQQQLQNTIVVICERKPDEVRATGTLCPKCSAPMGPLQTACFCCDFRYDKS